MKYWEDCAHDDIVVVVETAKELQCMDWEVHVMMKLEVVPTRWWWSLGNYEGNNDELSIINIFQVDIVHFYPPFNSHFCKIFFPLIYSSQCTSFSTYLIPNEPANHCFCHYVVQLSRSIWQWSVSPNIGNHHWNCRVMRSWVPHWCWDLWKLIYFQMSTYLYTYVNQIYCTPLVIYLSPEQCTIWCTIWWEVISPKKHQSLRNERPSNEKNNSLTKLYCKPCANAFKAC